MGKDDLVNKVEALLFASGKPLDVETIAEITEEGSKRKVKNTLKKLKESYGKKDTSLRIIEQDHNWKFTVREEYLPLVRKIVSDTELPKSVLETLAVIAWKSPVLQSEVIKVRTNKAYEHIDQLEKLSFIIKKKEGRSYTLTLSEKFFEYFDVENGDIKEMFKDSKGIEKELKTEQRNRKDETSAEESKDIKNNKKEDIEKALDAEKPHLGELEVVDSIKNEQPEGIQVVDSIKDGQDKDTERDKEDNQEDGSDNIEEVDEIVEELDEEIEAKKEFDEIEKEAIENEDDKH